MTPAQILKDSTRQEVLHKKCSNAELIMVRIFLYSDRIRSVEEVWDLFMKIIKRMTDFVLSSYFLWKHILRASICHKK